MSSVPNSVETVNAAATAIVTAESRVQPTSVRVHTYTYTYVDMDLYACMCVCVQFVCDV